MQVVVEEFGKGVKNTTSATKAQRQQFYKLAYDYVLKVTAARHLHISHGFALNKIMQIKPLSTQSRQSMHETFLFPSCSIGRSRTMQTRFGASETVSPIQSLKLPGTL